MNESLVRAEMTTGTKGSAAKGVAWIGLSALVLLFGLCTIFASVVAVAEAWHEHVQTQWPAVMARVDRCDLYRSSTGQRRWLHIHCRLSYEVAGEQNTANVYSRNAPSPEVPQYPLNQIGPFVDWVNEHPEGSEILVRYDPAHHSKVVLVATPMPGGAPRTTNNIKLVQFFAGGFLVLGIIALITRPLFPLASADSSMPLRP